jgi:hypothetical protein
MSYIFIPKDGEWLRTFNNGGGNCGWIELGKQEIPNKSKMKN